MIRRKIISTGLALLGLIVIGTSILYFIGAFKEQTSGILIQTVPESEVYLDGIKVGITPFESNIKAGEVSVKIIPTNNIFDDYETKLDMVAGVKTIIYRTFNSTQEESSGAIVSFEKISKDKSYITIASTPDLASVILDGKTYGMTPIRIDVGAGDHNLVVTIDGYDDSSFPIKAYKGYGITAAVKLAKSKVVSESPKEEVIPILGRIKINKNDVGFLRVRAGANIGFPEVGQVRPGEEYDFFEIGENGKWYKIQLPDVEGLPAGRQGWVASEFVTKI